jgi:hypothetical protein
MSKEEALATAKAMRAAGRSVQVAYQTLTHANRNGQQIVFCVYRVIENGVVIH